MLELKKAEEEKVREYCLYGRTIQVSHIKDDELLIMEGIQYVTPLTGGNVYVASSILPKAGYLIGHEFHSGNDKLLRIKEHCFCERPRM
ncbi:hypothetical protein [Paenibacillus thiaminolyticus]|uniref:hypothetical protein n=1 Tax=Paenibacillus thiaminolyticus TaxID=49283 RepID=UPI00254327D7|nr:hypothetical protein [Paenibacillus thiaminolyticus]WII39170.1 hypothetical protein O0V01_08815 [Paenibacillus thiaminolyticus]